VGAVETCNNVELASGTPLQSAFEEYGFESEDSIYTVGLISVQRPLPRYPSKEAGVLIT
jgi:hypothetical protein